MRQKVLGFALSAMLLALCVPVEAQQPKKIPRIGYLSAATLIVTPPVSSKFGRRYATSATSKARTLPSSADMLRGNVIRILSSQLSWCALKSISSWSQEGTQ